MNFSPTLPKPCILYVGLGFFECFLCLYSFIGDASHYIIVLFFYNNTKKSQMDNITFDRKRLKNHEFWSCKANDSVSLFDMIKKKEKLQKGIKWMSGPEKAFLIFLDVFMQG